jgi:endonuclease G
MKRSLRLLFLILILLLVLLGILFLWKKAHEKLRPKRDKPQSEQAERNTSRRKPLPDLDELPSEENTSYTLEELLPKGSKGELILHKGYALSYNESREQADWVMHLLPAPKPGAKRFRRQNNFREDPQVSTGSSSPDDYRNTGYDRGHLAPAADLSYDEEVLSESFYMSNMSPQRPGFNRGIWNSLENQVRDWAKENGNVWVITGPLFGKRPRKFGANQVHVPKAFYKIVFDFQEPELKMIGFILPNQVSKADLRSFACPIDSVETVSGFDFFTSLPDSLEEKLESQYAELMWFAPSAN